MTQNGDEGVDADGTDLWNRLNLEIFRTLVPSAIQLFLRIFG